MRATKRSYAPPASRPPEELLGVDLRREHRARYEEVYARRKAAEAAQARLLPCDRPERGDARLPSLRELQDAFEEDDALANEASAADDYDELINDYLE